MRRTWRNIILILQIGRREGKMNGAGFLWRRQNSKMCQNLLTSVLIFFKNGCLVKNQQMWNQEWENGFHI
nr:hypothetical protein Iba_chr10eCG14080 [Ipomoea batatas]